MEEKSGPVPVKADSPPSDEKTAPATNENASAPKAKPHRKRTKTGCLTCRKRRIKCGEEKPICKNCIKSRRDCEGYGQRVVFRQPVGPFPTLGPVPSMSNASGAMASTFMAHHSTYCFPDGATGTRQPYLPLAPRPHPYDGGSGMFTQSVSASIERHIGFVPGYTQRGYDTPLDSLPGNTSQLPITSHVTDDISSQDNRRSRISNTWEHDGDNNDSIASASDQVFPSHQYPSAYSFEPASSSQVTGVPKFATHECRNLTSVTAQNAYPPDDPVPAHLQYDYMTEDDEDYDVEVGSQTDTEQNSLAQHKSQKWSVTVPYTSFNQESQSYATFVSYNNLLATYRPSPFASPLLNPEAAQIFTHFITTVGAMISVFEGTPPIPSLITSGYPVPPESKNLWTYTIPSLALEHPALMHAILATSSFHLSKMTGQSPMASFRHYHYALRRIRKSVGLPHRRDQIGTLAATLILGYYEVMGGDHSKWCSHVAGGSQLIQETNFARLTKYIRDARAKAKREQAYMMEQGYPDSRSIPFKSEVDEGLVSVIMGRPVDYDDFRHVSRGIRDYRPRLQVTDQELDGHKIRVDLYWWYCKHDMYQSLISGNRLLMPYHRWGECPPRGRLGDLDATHGTWDHIVLLLARIAEFAANDRGRKLKAVTANGGSWRPPPGLFPPGSETAGRPQAPRPPQPDGPSIQPPRHTNRESSPPMYGMAPAMPVRLPAGFNQTPHGFPSPGSESSDSHEDLDMLTAQAHSDWQDILGACDEFENALGPGFQPLPPGTAPIITTPFGPAIQFRTHVVACVWAYYYVSRLLLHRVHPSMPPAAMMAVGIAAAQTNTYAQLIGRIAAGIHTPQFPNLPVDVGPTVSGILTEYLIAIFYAAVQYSDPAQRTWTMAFLRDITQLTGGRSASSVAGGCETAWIKAFEAGRGPPYERVEDVENVERRYGIVTGLGGMGMGPGDERRFVMVGQGESMHLAMGLLSIDGVYPSHGRDRIVEEE